MEGLNRKSKMSCRIDRVVSAESLVVLFVSGQIIGEHVDASGRTGTEIGRLRNRSQKRCSCRQSSRETPCSQRGPRNVTRESSALSVNGSRKRGRKRMGARRSKGQREGRTSKMHDTNRGGLDRHSDNGRPKVATERTPAISDLIGSGPNFPAVVEQLRTLASVDCAVLIRSGDLPSNVMETSCPQRTRRALR
jgi:hypothetical protein